MTKPPLLITGATGFLGRHLCRELLVRGIPFAIFARPQANTAWFVRHHITIHTGDLTDTAAVGAAVPGHRAVINLAAATDISNRTVNFAVNYTGVEQLAAACTAAGVTRFIQLSTTCASRQQRDAYGESKLAAEQRLADAMLKHTIFRPTMIYGAGSKEFETFVTIIRTFPVVPVIGNGDNRFQPVAVSDVIQAIITALERPASIGRTYDLAGPQPITAGDLIQTIARLLNLRRRIFRCPAAAALTFIRLLGRCGRHVPVTVDQALAFLQNTEVSLDAAARDLDFAPCQPEVGLPPVLAEITTPRGATARLQISPRLLPEDWPTPYGGVFSVPRTIIQNDPPPPGQAQSAPLWLHTREQTTPLITTIDELHKQERLVPEMIAEILEEPQFRPHRPRFTRLPFHYHRVPGRIRFALQRCLIRSRGQLPRFPRWPLDLTTDLLTQLHTGGNRPLAWPAGKEYAIALTHDIDTAQGFAACRAISVMEQERGLRSAWYIPGRLFPSNTRAIDNLFANQHEIGLHGFNHDNTLGFLPADEIRARLQRCAGWIETFAMKGFRTPSLLTTPALFDALPVWFRYDSSIPNSFVHTTAAQPRGCATIFPFRRGALTEIPLTLPLDDTLLVAGFSPEQILSLWRTLLLTIRQLGGMAVITTHSEPHLGGAPPMLAIYNDLLDHIAADPNAWVTTPAAIADRYAALP